MGERKMIEEKVGSFEAIITAKGNTTAEARNKILKVLAKAELDGDITYFMVNSKCVWEK
jgi:hypothetical protein